MHSYVQPPESTIWWSTKSLSLGNFSDLSSFNRPLYPRHAVLCAAQPRVYARFQFFDAHPGKAPPPPLPPLSQRELTKPHRSHVQPQPSLASLAQLACDLIVHNYRLELVGYLGLQDHVPAVGARDGLPGQPDQPGLALACEGERPLCNPFVRSQMRVR